MLTHPIIPTQPLTNSPSYTHPPSSTLGQEISVRSFHQRSHHLHPLPLTHPLTLTYPIALTHPVILTHPIIPTLTHLSHSPTQVKKSLYGPSSSDPTTTSTPTPTKAGIEDTIARTQQYLQHRLGNCDSPTNTSLTPLYPTQSHYCTLNLNLRYPNPIIILS